MDFVKTLVICCVCLLFSCVVTEQKQPTSRIILDQRQPTSQSPPDQSRPTSRRPLEVVSTTKSDARLALVIGNGAYKNSPLRNPPNDACVMGRTLRELGFAVIQKRNLNHQQMWEAIDAFGMRLMNRGGTGLFYYAGHGIQHNGKNYLIPVNAGIQKENALEQKAVCADMVLSKMRSSRNWANLMILDACWENPLASHFQKSEKGLAPMNSPAGTVIAHAASPGEAVSQGPGEYGLYTSQLIRHVKIPGLGVTDMLDKVREGVKRLSSGAQIPWESVNLKAQFCFMPPRDKPLRQPGRKKVVVDQLVIKDRPSKQRPAKPVESPKDRMSQPESEKPSYPIVKGRRTAPKPPHGRRDEMPPSRRKPGKNRASMPSGEWRESVTGIAFVYVKGGCYEMGCGPWTGNCGDDERPVHRVCVDDFYMGRHEVTVGQYMRFAKETGRHPEWMEKGSKYHIRTGSDDYYGRLGNALTSENHPVVGVSWNDAAMFAQWLSRKIGRTIHLPTEAEWECACRSGGKPERYSGGINLDGLARYSVNSGGPGPVGGKNPNGLGIWDMSGNVWEWCQDIYSPDAYAMHPSANPVHASGGFERVNRGGSWYDAPARVRCANRRGNSPDTRENYIGFRVSMTP